MKVIDKLAVKVVLAAMLGLGATAFGHAQETRQARALCTEMPCRL